MDFLEPILDPLDRLTTEEFTFWVRKAAHMSEFALLGLCLGGFGISLSQRMGQRLVFPWLFWALATAVTDEFIQTFTPSRSGELRDVLIDFTGACLGLLLSLGLSKLCKYIKNRGTCHHKFQHF